MSGRIYLSLSYQEYWWKWPLDMEHTQSDIPHNYIKYFPLIVSKFIGLEPPEPIHPSSGSYVRPSNERSSAPDFSSGKQETTGASQQPIELQRFSPAQPNQQCKHTNTIYLKRRCLFTLKSFFFFFFFCNRAVRGPSSYCSDMAKP